MIRLSQSTTDLISLITAQNGAKVTVGYSDATSVIYAGGNQLTSIASATTTTICAAPTITGAFRDIDYISIKNTFAGSHTITVQLNSNAGTLYPIITCALLTDESLHYTHAGGWCAIDANGNRKEAYGTIPSSNVQGTTTNNDATAGYIGEYQEASLAAGSATSLVTNTAKTVTSISLTAGDWDVSGWIGFIPGTTIDYVQTSSSTTNNTLGATNTTLVMSWASSTTLSTAPQIQIATYRYSFSSTTTLYLIGRSGFGSTCTAYGFIRARRVR